MKVLLDTQLLIWLAYTPELLSRRAVNLLVEPENTYVFSVVSIWEIAIKQALRKPNFQADAARVHDGLLAGGFEEINILSSHAIAAGQLPLLHRDPFDRLIIAQALADGLTLATADKTLTRYAPSVRFVG